MGEQLNQFVDNESMFHYRDIFIWLFYCCCPCFMLMTSRANIEIRNGTSQVIIFIVGNPVDRCMHNSLNKYFLTNRQQVN